MQRSMLEINNLESISMRCQVVCVADILGVRKIAAATCLTVHLSKQDSDPRSVDIQSISISQSNQ